MEVQHQSQYPSSRLKHRWAGSHAISAPNPSNYNQFLCNLECFHDTRPPSPPVFMFQFLKSSWRSLLLEARFLVIIPILIYFQLELGLLLDLCPLSSQFEYLFPFPSAIFSVELTNKMKSLTSSFYTASSKETLNTDFEQEYVELCAVVMWLSVCLSQADIVSKQ